MVELEISLLSMPSSYMTRWKRYVDYTIAYVKTDAIDHVLSILNSFHGNISFTYEQEINEKVSFLDILILHRKSTHNDIYTENHLHQMHGNKAHLKHYSMKELLDQEINHLQHVFVMFNVYSKWVVLQVLNKVDIDLSTTSSTKNQHTDTHKHTYACLPMQRDKR